MIREHQKKRSYLHFQYILYSLFFISFSVLVFQTHAQSKEVIDEWFLAGIFVYFMIFTLAYCLAAVNSSSPEKLTVLSSFFLLAIVLIPNLKYDFVDAFDPTAHYGSIKETINQGHVINVAPYENTYRYAVVSRILIASISLVSYLDVLMSVKLFMVISAALFPVFTFLVSKRLKTPKDISRNAITLSAVSFPSNAYIFAGTFFAQSIYIPFIYLIVLYAISSLSGDRLNMFIIICSFGFTLMFFHDPTTFNTLLLLIYMYLISVLITKKSKIHLLFWAIAFLTYFIYVSDLNFAIFAEHIMRLWNILSKGAELPTLTYYGTFSKLSLVDQSKVLVVNFANYMVMSILSTFGILLLAKKKLSNLRPLNSKSISFYYLMAATFTFGIVTFLAGYSVWRTNYRILYNIRFTVPFLSALTISFLQQKFPENVRKIFTSFVLFIIIYVSILQVFPYQPLIPKESVRGMSFPVQEFRHIATVYQRFTLRFSNTYNDRFNMYLEDSIRWISYAFMDLYKQKLITSSDPVIQDAKLGKQSLVVISPSSRANYIIYSRAVMVMDYFSEAGQNYSLLYTNGEWYIFGNP